MFVTRNLKSTCVLHAPGFKNHWNLLGSRTPRTQRALRMSMLDVVPVLEAAEVSKGPLGPLGSLVAAGLPSRWLRAKQDEGFATQRQINRLCTDLCALDPALREKAAESVANLCKGENFAATLACNLKPVLRGLKPGERAPVKLAILGALRSLAEKGHAISVALHAYALQPCFKDEDIQVQRKVCALYRVLAEEGAATMVAQDVKSIMHCYEATQAKGVPLAAPLDTLSAIAIAGEGAAVASVIEKLLANLKDGRPKIRKSTCATLGAIASGGAQELLGSLGLCAEAQGPGGQASLFEMLISLALDDNDDDVRLEAADALKSLPEVDPDKCDQTRERFPQLVKRLRFRPFRHCHGRKGEAIKKVCHAIGLESEHEAEEEGFCAICQETVHRDGRWCGPFQDPIKLLCGHVFHEGCCTQWFDLSKKCGRTPRCPICRGVAAG